MSKITLDRWLAHAAVITIRLIGILKRLEIPPEHAVLRAVSLSGLPLIIEEI